MRSLVLVACCMLALGAAPAAAQAPAPPAQAPPPAEQGVLKVTCAKPGAIVYIDNVEAGPAPITKYLPAGDHVVRVVADNHDPFVRKVTIKANIRSDVDATLVAGTGTAEFVVGVPGAKVSLDGGPETPLPVRLRDLPAGEHRYRITAPGHEPALGTFTFVQGRNYLFAPALQASRGAFAVTTDAPGARVFVDNQLLGTTPLSTEGVAPGAHVVRVEADGRGAVYLLIDSSDGAPVSLSPALPRTGARVRIKTGDAAAVLKFAGVEIGRGAVVELGTVAEGRLPLVVEAPGRKPADGRVEVPARGRRSWDVAWVAADDRGRSSINEIPPLHRRWGFWALVGAGAAGVGTGVGIAAAANRPVPPPDGDIVVTLP